MTTTSAAGNRPDFQCFVCGTQWQQDEVPAVDVVRFYVDYKSRATGGTIFICSAYCLKTFADDPRIDFDRTIFV